MISGPLSYRVFRETGPWSHNRGPRLWLLARLIRHNLRKLHLMSASQISNCFSRVVNILKTHREFTNRSLFRGQKVGSPTKKKKPQNKHLPSVTTSLGGEWAKNILKNNWFTVLKQALHVIEEN